MPLAAAFFVSLRAMRRDLTEIWLRALYSAVLYVLTPATVYHLIWRGFRVPGYFQRWGERYAAWRGAPHQVDVWVHAVSVGEVNAAAPVVDALRRDHPHLKLLITTITPTGSDRVRALWGDSLLHVYAPYDLPGAVGRFLDHFRPGVALVMETELWPNLLLGCKARGIRSYILNARLSARSLRGYRVLAPLIRRVVASVHRIGAQSVADGERFVQLGAAPEAIVDTGNLKFDIAVPAGLEALVAQFRQHVGSRPVWIAASTHPEEEALVVEIHQRLLAHFPDLLMVWAPRHPERFGRVVELARSTGWQVGRRSSAGWPQAGDAVFVLDTLGELMAFYACAEVAFVGGSLQAIGGHNLLEPAAVGTAMVTGPHLHNFVEIARRLREAGALEIGRNAEEVGTMIQALLADRDRRAQMAAEGRLLVERGRGALARTMAMLAQDLRPATQGPARR